MSRDIAIVRRLAGVTSEVRIEASDVGFDSRAYIVDDGKIVFKFSKTDEVRKSYVQEAQVLELLKPFFDNIPKIEWRGDDYIGYYGVVGKPLEKADLSIDAERKVGVKIGEFLKRLHSITPPNGMKRLSIDEEIDEHRQTFRQAKPILLHGLWSEEDSRKVTTLFALEMPLGLRKLGFDPVLCHGDLGAQNIILKDDGDVGFIDFGDAGVYDRAVDFMWLEREQQEEALEAYGADDVLRQKVAIRRKLAPVLNMPYFRDEDNGRELRKHMKKIHNALV